jgi:hypothetical protein
MPVPPRFRNGSGLRTRLSRRGGATPATLGAHRVRFPFSRATTFLHEARVPQQVVQAMIGHDSAEVHQLYVAIGADTFRKAAASLPEL